MRLSLAYYYLRLADPYLLFIFWRRSSLITSFRGIQEAEQCKNQPCPHCNERRFLFIIFYTHTRRCSLLRQCLCIMCGMPTCRCLVDSIVTYHYVLLHISITTRAKPVGDVHLSLCRFYHPTLLTSFQTKYVFNRKTNPIHCPITIPCPVLAHW